MNDIADYPIARILTIIDKSPITSVVQESFECFPAALAVILVINYTRKIIIYLGVSLPTDYTGMLIDIVYSNLGQW